MPKKKKLKFDGKCLIEGEETLCHVNGNNIKIEVSDNGSGIDTNEATEQCHRSLATIISKERLRILSRHFKQDYHLIVQNRETGGTLATVLLPQVNAS